MLSPLHLMGSSPGKPSCISYNIDSGFLKPTNELASPPLDLTFQSHRRYAVAHFQRRITVSGAGVMFEASGKGMVGCKS